MSAPKRKGRTVTMITATIPNELMAEVRRHTDLYKMNISQLVTQALQMRLGHGEDPPVDEPRYEAHLTAQLDTLTAMRDTFREDLTRYEAHIHAMTASINEHQDTLDALIKAQGTQRAVNEATGKRLDHVDLGIKRLHADDQTIKAQLASHEQILRQKAQILDDMLTERENIRAALDQLAAENRILQANQETLLGQIDARLRDIEGKLGGSMLIVERRLQHMEDTLLPATDDPLVDEARTRGRAFLQATETEVALRQAQEGA